MKTTKLIDFFFFRERSSPSLYVSSEKSRREKSGEQIAKEVLECGREQKWNEKRSSARRRQKLYSRIETKKCKQNKRFRV